MEQGKLSYKWLNACFHRIDIILEFELWEHNNCGEDGMIAVNKENDSYTHAYDNFRAIIHNMDDYTWYKFKE